MRRFLLLLSGVLWLCLALPAQAVIVDRIVAVVNNDVITLSELDQAAEPFYQGLLAQIKDPAERKIIIQRIRKKILQQLIDQRLVDQEVKRLHITVSDQEIDQFIKNFRRQQGLEDQKAFWNFLAAQGLTLDEYRKQVAKQIQRIKLLQSQIRERIVVTDQEIKQYYQTHYAQEEKRYQIAVIIISPPKAQKKLDEALALLKAGHSFAEVATKYSAFPDSGKGLGTFSLEELSPKVRALIKKLKPGEVSPPVQIGNNWEIFKLLAIKQNSTGEWEKLRPEIESRLFQEKVDQLFKKWLKNLHKRSYIRILL